MTISTPPPANHDEERQILEGERHELLHHLSNALEGPMLVLGFVWLILVILELTVGLSPFLTALNYTIWGLFGLQFIIELVIAPKKVAYLRHNWLTALALVLPALRIVRAVRVLGVLRAARGIRLVRVVSTANRGMRALAQVMGRRGLGYVLSLTLLVNVLGAAGIYAFEHDVAGSTITSFGTALWWTAMTLTAMGADYFPHSSEGRLLGLLLAIYGFAVFGYVTASIASLFVARDAGTVPNETTSAPPMDELRAEIAALRQRVETLIEAQVTDK